MPPEHFTHDQANRKIKHSVGIGRETYTVIIRSAER